MNQVLTTGEESHGDLVLDRDYIADPVFYLSLCMPTPSTLCLTTMKFLA